METRIRVENPNPDTELAVIKIIDSITELIPFAARKIIDESTPRGRLYRKGPITARFSRKLEKQGFSRVGKSRIKVGTRIHRASAKGQPPAKDTGLLYNKIRVLKAGKYTRRIRFDAPYSAKVNETRPYIEPAINLALELAAQKFI